MQYRYKKKRKNNNERNKKIMEIEVKQLLIFGVAIKVVIKHK